MQPLIPNTSCSHVCDVCELINKQCPARVKCSLTCDQDGAGFVDVMRHKYVAIVESTIYLRSVVIRPNMKPHSLLVHLVSIDGVNAHDV